MWYNQVNGAIRVCLLCKYVTVHRPTHSKYQSSISWTEARRLSIFQKQLSYEYKERTRVVLFFHLITMNLMTLEKAERVVKGRRG